MELQSAYKQKMATQLKEWNAQLELMEAKAKNLKADIDIKQASELIALRERLNSASAKMHEYEKATDEAWGELKNSADIVWDDIKTGFGAAMSKYK